MIRKRKEMNVTDNNNYNSISLILSGFLEGLVTGIVGAGGGFIIVPILMIFGKLNLR